MKSLWVKNVTGLYQEFFDPDVRGMLSSESKIRNNTLDAGILFWSSVLSESNIIRITDILQDNIQFKEFQTPSFLAICANKDSFVAKCIDYRTSLCNQTNDEQAFFSRLETLSILCKLFSAFDYYPFEINIQNGFVLDEQSLQTIYNNCLNERKNPYLLFIRGVVIPLIKEYRPSILFLSGRIGYFSTAIALESRKHIPDIHISVTRHSSEYYSLGKIVQYIRNNKYIFRAFDSIILDNFDISEKQLEETLGSRETINGLSHVITRESIDGCVLKAAAYIDAPRPSLIHSRSRQIERHSTQNSTIYDVYLNPGTRCYWNKCVFCGINRKYLDSEISEKVEYVENRVSFLCDSLPTNSYIWFVDEALHPDRLLILSTIILSSNKTFRWQARCRIDEGLLKPGLAEKLAQSGLRELRLGLESGSLRILKLMKKIDSNFQIKTVYDIVKIYSSLGISIHFPIIIGFPGEQESDRQLTYELISNLRKLYKSVTFNVNIFYFDIASPLFKKWDKYQITSITFPCAPIDFIGNQIGWDDNLKTPDYILEKERNHFMRDQLYDWMPRNALVTPVLFYRLAETIRNTLIWKASDSLMSKKKKFSIESILLFSDEITVFSSIESDLYIAYNWNTHHYLKCSDVIFDIETEWKSAKSAYDGIYNLVFVKGYFISLDDAYIYIEKMVKYGHLIIL